MIRDERAMDLHCVEAEHQTSDQGGSMSAGALVQRGMGMLPTRRNDARICRTSESGA